MVKRKRNGAPALDDLPAEKIQKVEARGNTYNAPGDTVYIQVVTGSYERVLHGITATVPISQTRGQTNPKESSTSAVSFSDTFLFHAHASAIRCLAISPPSSTDIPANKQARKKRILASGSTDERINLYQISTARPSALRPSIPSLAGTTTHRNPQNRELGALLHHSGTVTSLSFPSRGKLLSGATDNTIAVTRTRDWTVLSTIKAPIPKPVGRPSGDTLAPGEVPAGVNDFAIHPSNKLMVTVGKGEKCMRLWNLVTGRKAGVLSFSRELLTQVGEGRYASGEGRRVIWDAEGEEFVVGFERGAVVYGMDCRPTAKIVPKPATKLHQIHYLPGSTDSSTSNLLAVSTEDGRVIFYPTNPTTSPPVTDNARLSPVDIGDGSSKTEKTQTIPECTPIAQIGGLPIGIAGRVKDFEIIDLHSISSEQSVAHQLGHALLVITGSSDGAVRLWSVNMDDLTSTTGASQSKPIHETAQQQANGQDGTKAAPDASSTEQPATSDVRQTGTLVGTAETGNRIMCLKAFVLDGEPEDEVDGKGGESDEATKNGVDESSDDSDLDEE